MMASLVSCDPVEASSHEGAVDSVARVLKFGRQSWSGLPLKVGKKKDPTPSWSVLRPRLPGQQQQQRPPRAQSLHGQLTDATTGEAARTEALCPEAAADPLFWASDDFGDYLAALADEAQQELSPRRTRRILKDWVGVQASRWLKDLKSSLWALATTGKRQGTWESTPIWNCSKESSDMLLAHFARGLSNLGFSRLQWWHGQKHGWQEAPYLYSIGSADDGDHLGEQSFGRLGIQARLRTSWGGEVEGPSPSLTVEDFAALDERRSGRADIEGEEGLPVQQRQNLRKAARPPCSVCRSQTALRRRLLPCYHELCNYCAKRQVGRPCPTCRAICQKLARDEEGTKREDEGARAAKSSKSATRGCWWGDLGISLEKPLSKEASNKRPRTRQEPSGQGAAAPASTAASEVARNPARAPAPTAPAQGPGTAPGAAVAGTATATFANLRDQGSGGSTEMAPVDKLAPPQLEQLEEQNQDVEMLAAHQVRGKPPRVRLNAHLPQQIVQPPVGSYENDNEAGNCWQPTEALEEAQQTQDDAAGAVALAWPRPMHLHLGNLANFEHFDAATLVASARSLPSPTSPASAPSTLAVADLGPDSLRDCPAGPPSASRSTSSPSESPRSSPEAQTATENIGLTTSPMMLVEVATSRTQSPEEAPVPAQVEQLAAEGSESGVVLPPLSGASQPAPGVKVIAKAAALAAANPSAVAATEEIKESNNDSGSSNDPVQDISTPTDSLGENLSENLSAPDPGGASSSSSSAAATAAAASSSSSSSTSASSSSTTTPATLPARKGKAPSSPSKMRNAGNLSLLRPLPSLLEVSEDDVDSPIGDPFEEGGVSSYDQKQAPLLEESYSDFEDSCHVTPVPSSNSQSAGNDHSSSNNNNNNNNNKSLAEKLPDASRPGRHEEEHSHSSDDQDTARSDRSDESDAKASGTARSDRTDESSTGKVGSNKGKSKELPLPKSESAVADSDEDKDEDEESKEGEDEGPRSQGTRSLGSSSSGRSEPDALEEAASESDSSSPSKSPAEAPAASSSSSLLSRAAAAAAAAAAVVPPLSLGSSDGEGLDATPRSPSSAGGGSPLWERSVELRPRPSTLEDFPYSDFEESVDGKSAPTSRKSSLCQ